MKITVAVILCHALAPIPSPVCREEVVVQQDMSMQACMMAQPAIADWKNHSIFRGDNWQVTRFKCVPGDYTPKEAI